MRKVIVIGCPGSGKSTFSKALYHATGLPLYHLDMMYWAADGTNVPKYVFMERLNQVLRKESWIIDGNYGSTMELRMRFCDTVFFLDYPPDICIDGIRSRKGKERTDIPCITPEDEDDKFVDFIKDYRLASRPAVLELLSKYSHKRIVIFENRKEANDFLSQICEFGTDESRISAD